MNDFIEKMKKDCPRVFDLNAREWDDNVSESEMAAFQIKSAITKIVESEKPQKYQYGHRRIPVESLPDLAKKHLSAAEFPIEFQTDSIHVIVNGVSLGIMHYFFSAKISKKTISLISEYIDGAFDQSTHSFLITKTLDYSNPDATDEINYANYPVIFDTNLFHVKLTGPKLMDDERVIEFSIERKKPTIIEDAITKYIEATTSPSCSRISGPLPVFVLQEWLIENSPDTPSIGIEKVFYEATLPISFKTPSFDVTVRGYANSIISYTVSRRLSQEDTEKVAKHIESTFKNVSQARSFYPIGDRFKTPHFPYSMETARFTVKLIGVVELEDEGRTIEFRIERK